MRTGDGSMQYSVDYEPYLDYLKINDIRSSNGYLDNEEHACLQGFLLLMIIRR